MQNFNLSTLMYLITLFLSTSTFATLACTDTVVTRDYDPSRGEEDGGVSEGGAQTENDSKSDSAANGCEGTDAESCIPCTAHSDCGESACDKTRGRCVPCMKEGDETIGCSDDSPVCAIDGDDSTKNICVECATHDDCLEGACDVEQNRCVPCLLDIDATVGCDEEQPVCRIAENNEDNRCVQCLEHADCENGACDTDQNACVPCLLEDQESIGCDQDGNTPLCMTGEETSENRCVACLNDDDCDTGVCDPARNACVACLIEDDEQIGCDDDEGPLCRVDDDDSENNACVECLEMSDCDDPSASACDSETNQCTGCSEDSDCEGIEGLGACDDGMCVECTDSETHCSDTTPICSENECRACESHDECSFSSEACNRETGACFQFDDVVYVDEVNCESDADGSPERPFCQISPALNSITNQNSTRIPILVRAGSYSTFAVIRKEPISIIGKEDAIVFGNDDYPAVLVRYDSDVIIEGLEVSLDKEQEGIECEGTEGASPSTQPTLLLRDMTVTGGRFGVKASDNCNLTIEKSEIIGVGSLEATDGVLLEYCSGVNRVVDTTISRHGNGVSSLTSTNEIQLDDNIITSNKANGIHIDNCQIIDKECHSDVTLSGNTIEGNGGIGVLVSSFLGRIVMDRNTIMLNEGGGVNFSVSGNFSMTNNIIARNGTMGSTVGGVLLFPGEGLNDPVFDGNTVVDNLVQETSGSGVAGVNSFASLTIENSIVYGNIPNELSPAVKPNWCLLGDTSGDGNGESNIRNRNPLFKSASSNDYHLTADSPCIDKANPSSTLTSDIDGDPRPQGGRSDIGADEAM